MSPAMKISQPRFLSKDEVLTLHQGSLHAYGGADGFLSEGALESAIAQPQQGFAGEFAHDFPFGMAAAYGYHIAMNHAFRDGNKRTAFAAMVSFLRMNGWNFGMPDEEASSMMLELIENHHGKEWLSTRLEDLSRERTSFELRDFFSTLTVGRIHDFLIACTADLKPAELDQSAQEAATHIPAVKELFEASKHFYDSGNQQAGSNMGNQAMQLVALFRIAEDMGYEW